MMETKGLVSNTCGNTKQPKRHL